MKQQILNLKKKLLIVEIGGELSTEFLSIMNEYGMAEILGKLTDITEEQFQNWVEKFYNGGVRDYREGSFDPADDLANFFLTAEESFFSYLESQGIYFSNPLDWEKKAYFLKGSENSWGHDDLKRWQEAEQKVWKIENTYLFEIL